MPNYFDRFDEEQRPAGNYFDRFDPPLPEEPEPEPVAAPPPEEPGFFDKAVGVASEVGRGLKTDAKIVGSGIAELSAGIYGAGAGIAENIAKRNLDTPTPRGDTSRGAFERVRDAVADTLKMANANPLVGMLAAKAAGVMKEGYASGKAASEAILPKAEIAQYPRVARAAIQGLQSFAQQLPAMAASLAVKSPAPALASMTASTGGGSYMRGRQAGLDPEHAALYGLTDGGIEYLTEVGPTGVLVKAMNDIPGFWKAFWEFGKRDMAGEEIATFTQNLNEVATIHPEKPIGEFLTDWQARLGDAGDTAIATLVSAGAQTGLMRAVHAGLNREKGVAPKEPSLLDELDRVTEEVQGEQDVKAEIDSTQQQARQAAAAEGGDALDQEVAAAVASMNRTGDARGAKVAAMTGALQGAQNEARGAQKQADIEAAYAQRDDQKANELLASREVASAAVQPEVGGESGPATMADVWPTTPPVTPKVTPIVEAPKTLAERRSQTTTTPAQAATPLALPAPKTGPAVTTQQRIPGAKGTETVTTERGGPIVVNQAGEAQVLSENAPTAPGPNTFNTLAVRRKAIREERIRTPVVEVQKAAEQPAAKPRVTFKTAKGSSYVVETDGRTTRDKAPRPEHPGEQGPQPTSEETFYVDSENLEPLGEIQAQGGPKARVARVGPDLYGIQYLEGKDQGKFERRTAVRVQREPAVGLTPVELWEGGQRVHFGNPITEVGQETSKPAEIPPPQARSAQLAAPKTLEERRQRGQTVRAEKAEPQERPIAPRVAKERIAPTAPAPEPTVEPEAAIRTLAGRKARRARRALRKAAERAKQAVEQQAETPPERGPTLRYSDASFGLTYEEAPNNLDMTEDEPRLRTLKVVQLKPLIKDTTDRFAAGELTEDQYRRKIDRLLGAQKRAVEREKKGAPAPRPLRYAEAAPKAVGVPLERAQERLAKMTVALGERFSVLRHPREAPPKVLEQMKKDGQLGAPGVYDASTDTVYLFVENNRDEKFLERTAAHEALAHLGVRQLMPAQEHGDLMESVYRDAEDRAWVNRFMEQHGLNEQNPEHRAVVGDEYIAHIAEEQTEPKLLQRVAARVRQLLRDLGFNVKWSDNDLRGLLMLSKTNLFKLSGHAWHHKAEAGLRYAAKPPPKGANALTPDGIRIRQDMTLEATSQYAPPMWRRTWDWIAQTAHEGEDNKLAFLHLNNLADNIPPGKMDSAPRYYLEAADQNGTFNEFLNKHAPLAIKAGTWHRTNSAKSKALSDIIHASTLAGPDPSLPYSPRYSGLRKGKPVKLTDEQVAANRQWQRAYQVLRSAWEKLDPQAQKFFTGIRDGYLDLRNETWNALTERVNAVDASPTAKQTLLDTLRREFEHGRVAGVYFRLFRKGKYWAVAKDKATGENVYAIHSENMAQVDAWADQMAADGFTAFGGESAKLSKKKMEEIDPGFVARITDLTKNEFDEPELADEIWQLYLAHLPEMSNRKQYMHRKGRLGFSEDYVQAFAHTMFHGAHQVARLRHGYKLQMHLRNMEKEVRALQEKRDPSHKAAAPIFREFQRRHEWVNNPMTSRWANMLTAAGFLYQLSLSPAPGMVNMTQVPLVTWPDLIGEHGPVRATRELNKAWREFIGHTGPLSTKLKGWEQEVMQDGDRRGLFTATNVSSMVGLGEQGAMFGGRMERTEHFMGYLFSLPEVWNRESTYLASARLWRIKHPPTVAQNAADIAWRRAKTPEQRAALWPATSMAKATEYSFTKTVQTQGDYSNFNRPRVLQGNVPKIMGLFRGFGLFMTYRLVRDFKTSAFMTKQWDNETPAEFKQRKHEARVRFLGTIGMVGVMGGVSAMPLYWAAQVIAGAFSDDDEPIDIDAAMRAELERKWAAYTGSKATGKFIAQTIMEGPVSALTGAALSARIGLNNLFIQEPPENKYGGDLMLWYAQQAFGFFGSIAYNVAELANPRQEGYEERALERVAPAWWRNPQKAIRYAQEGVTTKQGNMVLPRSELSNWEIGLQAAGFQPLDVKWQYGKNRAVLAEAEKLEHRMAGISNRWTRAKRVGDKEATDEAWQEAQEFHKKNPHLGLPMRLSRSLMQRARYGAESVNGVYVSRRMRRRLNEKYGNAEYEEEPVNE